MESAAGGSGAFMDGGSRDYSVEGLRSMDDGRFTVTFKEAVFFQITCLLATAGILGIGWILCPEDTEEIRMILGVPEWYLAGVMALAVLFAVWTAVCHRFGGEMSLEARK